MKRTEQQAKRIAELEKTLQTQRAEYKRTVKQLRSDYAVVQEQRDKAETERNNYHRTAVERESVLRDQNEMLMAHMRDLARQLGLNTAVVAPKDVFERAESVLAGLQAKRPLLNLQEWREGYQTGFVDGVAHGKNHGKL